MSLISDKTGCLAEAAFAGSCAGGVTGVDGVAALGADLVDLDITKRIEGESS
jgi:hypothetical protein